MKSISKTFFLERYEVQVRPQGPDRKPLAVFFYHVLMDYPCAMHADAQPAGRDTFGFVKVNPDNFHAYPSPLETGFVSRP
jgi:hypothetical protein